MASSTRALPRGRRLPAPLNQISGPQWLVLLVVLAGMTLAGNYLANRVVDDEAATETGYQTGAVTRRTIESAVSATGTVAATRQVRVTFPTTGQVAEVHVRQGDTVTEGQPLATLNAFNLEVKRDQARSNLGTAQYRLEALLNGPTNSDIAAVQQTVSSAQSSLTRAQNDLFTLLAGPNADEVAQARAALERAQASLAAAQANFDRLVNGTDLTLRPEHATLQAARSTYQQALATYTNRTQPNALDVANAQATLATADASLEGARAKLSQVLAGPDPLDVAIAQAAVTTALATLDSARAKLGQVLAGPDPLDVANARNQVTAAEAALTAARVKLQEAQTPAQQAVDLGTLEAQVAAARAAVASAESRVLDSFESREASERAAAEAALASARAQLAKAQGDLSKALTPTLPASAEVATAQQAVTTAETNLRNAQNNLAKLQQGPAAAELAAAQQTVTAAESGLATARNNLAKLHQGPSAAEVAAAQQTVTTAEGQVQTARNNLDKLLAGGTPEEVAAASAALESARTALETAQTNWDRLVSRADLESRPEYTALMSARSEYQTALTAYNLKTQGPKPGDVESAQAAVDAANALVNSSLARLAQVLGGSLPTDIGVAREAVANAELALKQAQHDLDSAVVRAPFPATVVSVGIGPGDQIGASTNAFTLLDPNLIRVDATVDESNVIKLKQGMPVTVTFDALQGRQFQGVVATVTPAGVTQQGVVTFPVTVVFNAQGFTVPPGTTANLRVVVESKQGALAAPSRAIVRQGRQSFVQVLVDGKPELKPVTTGVTGDNLTEILEGVEEGEQIVIASPQQQRQGQTGTFGSGGLPGLGTGAPGAPAQQPAQQPPARR